MEEGVKGWRGVEFMVSGTGFFFFSFATNTAFIGGGENGVFVLCVR